MKCEIAEETLALYVEGDLPEAQLRQIDTHLPACADCRQFIGELRESQSVLRWLREDTISTAALSNVRQNVMNEIANTEAAIGWALRLERLFLLGYRRYALAGLAMVLVATGILWHRAPPPPQIAAMRPAPPVAVEALPAPVAVVRPRRSSKRPARPKVAQSEPKELVVKMFTDDPNIVIYWILDQKGEAE